MINSVNDFTEGRCLMCNIELLPEERKYHSNNSRSMTRIVVRNKKFCDNLCFGYFQKRVYADEHGIKLDE